MADPLADLIKRLRDAALEIYGQSGESDEPWAVVMEEAADQLAEVAAVRGAERRWQSIETAPKDGTNVLLWCTDIDGGNGRVNVGSWHPAYNGSWWDRGMEYTLNNPTHWMPLPGPPSLTPPSDQETR